jgi:pimeloyl-ACP methyl ester carboxylesterase
MKSAPCLFFFLLALCAACSDDDVLPDSTVDASAADAAVEASVADAAAEAAPPDLAADTLPLTPRCVAYYDKALAAKAPRAAAWCKGGAVMRWTNAKLSKPVELFYRCAGKPTDPAVYLQHGWPTSSFDFEELFAGLSTDRYVCALDTPGYGFADKPDGYPYSMLEDGEIVEAFIRDVMKVKQVALVSHDKGDSVALELLHRYVTKPPGFKLESFTMMNGSIYLPKAAISNFQKLLLSPATGPGMAKNLTGGLLAAALGAAAYIPPLDAAGVAELASVFDFDSGTDRLHQTIQYLNERSVYEDKRWLAALGKSTVPVTLIWGEKDPVAVPAVADYVWTNVLAKRSAPASYWRVPCASHYVQNDRPKEVLAILRGEALPTHTETTCLKTYLYKQRKP